MNLITPVDILKQNNPDLDDNQALELLMKNKQLNESLQLITGDAGGSVEIDSLGKIPLALQQLALARERANTANDMDLSKSLSDAMDKLLFKLISVAGK